jgi:hypothetical protein
LKPGDWKITAQRDVSKAMEPQCDSFCAQVNPDASHLVARPAEIDTASAAERGFPGPNRSAGTGGRPSAPTHAAPLGCTHPSSTAARDRSASTPPPGIRICRSTAIVRRPWARCLSHGTTSKVRVELKSPILIRRGSSPVAAAGSVSYTVLGPLPIFFSAADYRSARSPPLLLQIKQPITTAQRQLLLCIAQTPLPSGPRPIDSILDLD